MYNIAFNIYYIYISIMLNINQLYMKTKINYNPNHICRYKYVQMCVPDYDINERLEKVKKLRLKLELLLFNKITIKS